LGLALLLLSGCGEGSPGPRDSHPETTSRSVDRPNVILVVYDARRRGDFSFGPDGNRRGDTPFLAEFAEDAITFPSAVSTGCWTLPVHATMFSGLPIGALDIDYYSEGWGHFSAEFDSLAEILQQAGYHTIAWADHPYFFRGDVETSLVRGFESFSVIRDFKKTYATHTNVGTPGGAVELTQPLAGISSPVTDLPARVARFNAGDDRPVVDEVGDVDPESGIVFGRLHDLFLESDYFDRRYREPFDEHVFDSADGRPFFLFINLHICQIARPDAGLWERWLIRTVMLNAAERGADLNGLMDGESVDEWAVRALAALDIAPRLGPHDGPGEELRALKHIFDNRFYDENFRGLWEYLTARGLTDEALTIVCSDHGMSFSEKGEEFYHHGGARPDETIVRVPLIVRLPASSPDRGLHGVHADRVSLIDVFPTVLDLALGEGVYQRELPVHGKSVVTRLREDDLEDVIFAESMLRPSTHKLLPGVAGSSAAVYRGDRKLIVAPDLYRVPSRWPRDKPLPGDQEIDDALVLLFDLARDPDEAVDLSRADGDTVAELIRIWGALRPVGSRSTRPDAAGWDEEALQTLRDLGYIE